MNLTKASLLFLTCSACSGLLVIPEPKAPAIPCETSAACGVGLICDVVLGECIASPGGCSLAVPDGDCPLNYLCVGGNCLCANADACTCVPSGCPPTTWCEGCLATQTCNANGECVDITNPCSPAHPDGECAGEEICIGGFCVPNETPCSDEYPAGWCQDGFTCFEGRCRRTDESPCTQANPTGRCDSGLECKLPGQCEIIQCAPGKPGACPDDFVCPGDCTQSPCCEQLPCSPQHVDGTCTGGQFCSCTGACLAPDVCAATCDCSASEYCGTTAVCLNTGLGECVVDADCEIQLSSVFGQGYECPAGLCTERLTCDVPADCVPTKFCSSQGNCMVYPLCDGDLDCPAAADPPEVCSKANAATLSDYTTTCAGRSTCHVCIDSDTCLGRNDCSGGYVCSHEDPRTCIPPGECRVDTDCPPGRTCDLTVANPTYQQCVVTGTPCSTNAFKYSGCAATEFSCCDSASASDCCPAGQVCSLVPTENVCIPFGKCVVATDCLTGYFDCVDYECVPTNPCAGCLANEICSTVGGCVPNDRCAADADCALGERCNANWRCEPVPECGFKSMASGSSLPPNILVALDRSASMQLCGAGVTNANCCGYCPTALAPCGTCTATDRTTCPDADYYGYAPTPTSPFTAAKTCVDGVASPGGDCHLGVASETVSRWEQAVQAVKEVIQAQEGKANFGLTLFPHAAGTETCATDCNWYSCSDRTSNNAGIRDVAVGPSSRTAIDNLLDVTAPGGGTPTGQTLRAVVADLPGFGLNSATTQNAVLLVTDGEAIGDFAPRLQQVCIPPCSDSQKNGDETDTDCGGSCGPCADTKGCKADIDCQSQVCRLGACRPNTCGNDVKNGDETDTDCGGSCGPCADGAACGVAADCGSNRCGGGYCLAATCADTVKNGGETDTDCGGGCTAKCADGKGCALDSDCANTACQGGLCRIATCHNHTQDGNETTSDCGGPDCGRCADGATCLQASDCLSNDCTGAGTKTCTRPQCSDGVKNGWETDVDCGTADVVTCPTTGGTPSCLGGTAACSGGGTLSCVGFVPTCTLGAPTCGGGTGCGACAGGKVCDSDADCLSSSCGQCNQTEYACKVNSALDQLYASSPRVSTYVVAFNFAETGGNLNCHAFHGRTERRYNCPGLTAANCSTYTPTPVSCSDGTDCPSGICVAGGQCENKCYYNTTDLDTLKTELGKIIKQVRGCSFPLTSTPPSATRLYLYLQNLSGSPGVPNVTRVERYVGWDYDTVNNRIDVFGTACDDIKSGTVTPLVFEGCYCEEC